MTAKSRDVILPSMACMCREAERWMTSASARFLRGGTLLRRSYIFLFAASWDEVARRKLYMGL